MIVAAISAAVVCFTAIFTYLYLQPSEIHFKNDIFIHTEPLDVFMYFKNPKVLQELHYKINYVHVRRQGTSEEGMEIWDYHITEEYPHIGPHMYAASSIADQDSLKVIMQFQSLYGLIYAHFTWRFGTGHDPGGRRGTRVQEESNIHTPYALEHFVNRTVSETHAAVLMNLKLVMEGVRDEELEGRDKDENDWDFDDEIRFEL